MSFAFTVANIKEICDRLGIGYCMINNETIYVVAEEYVAYEITGVTIERFDHTLDEIIMMVPAGGRPSNK